MHLFNLEFGNIPYEELSLMVWFLVAMALFFDFLNGFHDAANSIATVVSTRVLSPQTAVAWAAFFNFVAFVVFPLGVGKTIYKGIVLPTAVEGQMNEFLLATLFAACLWNLLTWYLALPTSSSHALIGGMVGAALAMTNDVEVLQAGLLKTVIFIVVAPALGVFAGLSFGVAVMWTFRYMTPRRVDQVFRKGQLVSAAWFSLNHGGNDAQKTMGVILLLLLPILRQQNSSLKIEDIELHHYGEIILACHLMIGLGTLFGGWRIVKTMGQGILRLRPLEGFCAESGAGVAVAVATALGSPVSTTHTITGAIVGVGAMKRWTAVRWGIAGQVVWAWILTIPGAALMAALCWWVIALVKYIVT